jgi:cobalt-zinc-cadmium efflux system protein
LVQEQIAIGECANQLGPRYAGYTTGEAAHDLEAVRRALAALPGVACVSDLHVWATGTTDVALTAHLAMPGGHPDDAFFRAAAERMRERFAIGHVTLQATSETLMTPCDGAAVAAPAPRPRAHSH